MTYEESYRKAKSLEELKKEVEDDLKIAAAFGLDREANILKAANKVANEKFKESFEEE